MAEDERRNEGQSPDQAQEKQPHRLLGSLRDALAAASKADRVGEAAIANRGATKQTAVEAGKKGGGEMKDSKDMKLPQAAATDATELVRRDPAADAKAAMAARETKVAGAAALPADPPPLPPAAPAPARQHVEMVEKTSPVGRGAAQAAMKMSGDGMKTQLVRGKIKVARSSFHADPVVAWLVVVGGPGLGAFRPVFEGNNTVGRSKAQRIPIDFGDDTISNEEQAYIRYDSTDRKFLFVPNLAKTNVVSLNDRKPTQAVELKAMDVITMGHTQLVFVPFCGEEFDWAELTEQK